MKINDKSKNWFKIRNQWKQKLLKKIFIDFSKIHSKLVGFRSRNSASLELRALRVGCIPQPRRNTLRSWIDWLARNFDVHKDSWAPLGSEISVLRMLSAIAASLVISISFFCMGRMEKADQLTNLEQLWIQTVDNIQEIPLIDPISVSFEWLRCTKNCSYVKQRTHYVAEH